MIYPVCSSYVIVISGNVTRHGIRIETEGLSETGPHQDLPLGWYREF